MIPFSKGEIKKRKTQQVYLINILCDMEDLRNKGLQQGRRCGTWVKPQLEKQASRIGISILVLAPLSLTQLPVNAPVNAADDEPSPWAPDRKSRMEFQASA